MKILVANKYFWLKGGSETAFFGLNRLLEENGNSVVPFSMADDRNFPSQYEQHFIENIDYSSVKLIDKISSACKVIFSFEAKRKMDALLKKVEPQVAHFHIFQHQISPSVFVPLRNQGIPLVLTLHDLKPICPNYKMLTHDGICERCKGRKFINCFLHRCTKGSQLNSLVNSIEMYLHYALGFYQGVDRYIAVSEFYRNKMLEFGFRNEQVVHIPNFIDANRFIPSKEDGGYGIYFGRLSEEKGVLTLLSALQKRPDIPFVVVGSGPLEDELKAIAEVSSLKNVTFTGFKTGKELNRLISRASFSVLPSEWYENCPMSVLESLALERPVIGARIGGIPELISDQEDGLTFESGNVDDLADRIGELWDKPGWRREMGQAGRRKVERHFTPGAHYEKTMAVYRSAIK